MSLYLKYRPNDFENLVGQDFIKNTLKKAISNDKLVGAYLFCGPRGTGKTSCARIFAKTINCLDQHNGNPCLKCEICNDIKEDSLIDIVEIDAASNTGVDNIRELIQKAQFKPTKAKYKVYIIDEVHMLSPGAFNALLKILEEPPSHVKFILATTEINKVIETIISRCQRYDFKKINDIDIKNRLLYIAKNEQIEIDELALNFIIKNSGGGLRNAISLFEQYIVDGKVLYENIIKNLGLISVDKISNFYNLLLNGDTKIIEEFDNFIDSGNNIKLFFKELFYFIKEDIIKKISNQNNITNELFILDSLDKTFIRVKNSQDENTSFLIGILQILNFLNSSKINNNNFINNNLENSKNNNIINEEIYIKKNKKHKEEIEIEIEVKETEKDIKEDSGEIKEDKIKTKEKNKSKISNDDIDNIFGNNVEHENKNNNDFENKSSIFDKEKYIIELKKLGANGAVIFSIKGADINLIGNIVNIKSKTKIAFDSLNKSTNKSILIKGLENIGINNSEINLL